MPPSSRQLDLLRDWEPPAATVRFEAEQVRAATLPHLICRAVSAALKGTDLCREDVAKRMSEFLGGDPVTINMLNRYASPASEEHSISLARFVALLHATKDRRLLELLAEMMGWTVIERKFLPMIELAAVTERQRELGRHADALRRKASQGGAL
jgi:hypothetical protein